MESGRPKHLGRGYSPPLQILRFAQNDIAHISLDYNPMGENKPFLIMEGQGSP
jgi:hypothetical protein